MEFSQRLAALRKERALTQKALAGQVGVHVTQIQRYESGAIEPTLDVLRRLAVALSVSADLLVFDKTERGPDDDLKLQFEAVSRMPPEDKQAIKTLLDGMIIKQRARHMFECIGGYKAVTPTYHFEWDPPKAAANLRKHGIDFEQAATVFLDPLQLTLFDESHSEGDEERWVTLGQAESGTLLVVVHTHRDINDEEVLIRLISARPVTLREQRQYQGD